MEKDPANPYKEIKIQTVNTRRKQLLKSLQRLYFEQSHTN